MNRKRKQHRKVWAWYLCIMKEGNKKRIEVLPDYKMWEMRKKGIDIGDAFSSAHKREVNRVRRFFGDDRLKRMRRDELLFVDYYDGLPKIERPSQQLQKPYESSGCGWCEGECNH